MQFVGLQDTEFIRAWNTPIIRIAGPGLTRERHISGKFQLYR